MKYYVAFRLLLVTTCDFNDQLLPVAHIFQLTYSQNFSSFQNTDCLIELLLTLVRQDPHLGLKNLQPLWLLGAYSATVSLRGKYVP